MRADGGEAVEVRKREGPANRSGPGGAGGMRADGGEAVEVRKREGLAEGTNEEDGRHGLRGRSEVGELVRMRSRLQARRRPRRRRGMRPHGGEAVEMRKHGGWPGTMKRTAAMVSRLSEE